MTDDVRATLADMTLPQLALLRAFADRAISDRLAVLHLDQGEADRLRMEARTWPETLLDACLASDPAGRHEATQTLHSIAADEKAAREMER